jgi:hypothetical protein
MDPSLYYSTKVEPPRSLLNDISGCDCTRTVFNISIPNTFGMIQNSLFLICIMAPLILLGIILTKNYYKKYKADAKRVNHTERENGSNAKTQDLNLSRKQVIKYALTLLALAGGIVHLVVFPEHGSLHVYYSIFLLAAAGGQIAYGVLYFLVMLSKPFYEIPIEQFEEIKVTYRHNMAVNLFEFMGTAVLVGLYIYVVIFPPPLSPINQPEEIEIAGVLSKSVEITLLIGIMFIIRWDRQAFQKILLRVTYH